jgi:uncharacterized protein
MRIALIDAGPLIALFDTTEPAHRHYEGLLADSASAYRLYTTWPCVVEASHLLDSVARLEMLKWVALGGVQVFPFQADDLLPMTQWMQGYTEAPRSEMDFADASLYWLAHETGVTAVLTLDIKDFTRYRLPDGRAFEIV